MLFFSFSLVLSAVSIHGYNNDKIQNGTRVDIKEYPFVGSMQNPKQTVARHRCMTNLVTTTWSLTAAHCNVIDTSCIKPVELINFELYGIYIIMGTTDLQNPGPEAQERDIMKGVVHPRFITGAQLPFSVRYDLGAVQVQPPFTLTAHVNLMPFFPEREPYNGAIEKMKDPTFGDWRVRIVGWGGTRIYGNTTYPPGELRYSTVLLFGRFNLVTNEVCCRASNRPAVCLDELRLTGYDCAFPIGYSTSGAPGDSGAPVVAKFETQNNEMINVIVGIYKGGIPLRKPGGVYVRKITLLAKYELVLEFKDQLLAGSLPPHDELGRCPFSSKPNSVFLFFVTAFNIYTSK